MKAQVSRSHMAGRALRLFLCPFTFVLFLFSFYQHLSSAALAGLPAQIRTAKNSGGQNSRTGGSLKFQQAMAAGRQRMQKKDYDGAIPFLEEAARLYPRRADAKQLLLIGQFQQQYQAGLRYRDRGDWTHAQASLQRALRVASAPAMMAQANLANYQLSLVEGARCMQNRSYEASAPSYQMALALAPNDHAALTGLTEARYHSSFQAGLSALAKGDFDQARGKFRECLAYRPGDDSVLRRIEQVNRIESETDQFQSRLQAANASLDAGAWEQADGEIRALVGIMQRAEQMGVHSATIFGYRPLVVSYTAYANHDFKGALQLSQVASGKADAVRAAKFRQFLRRMRRSYYLRTYAPALLAAYGCLFLGSLYAGLKKTLTPAAGATT